MIGGDGINDESKKMSPAPLNRTSSAFFVVPKKLYIICMID